MNTWLRWLFGGGHQLRQDDFVLAPPPAEPAPPCFHWHDANDDEPPIGVPVVGMWIDSDGTTSTMIVTYGDDPTDAGWSPGWTYDGLSCRPPHAWCTDLDAHQPH